MKLSIVDAEIVIRDTVAGMNLGQPYTFNDLTFEDASASAKGDLSAQDNPFFVFSSQILNTHRTGPAVVAASRCECDLTISYYTKTPAPVIDSRLMEQVAAHFAERTLQDVRFRTFTPFPPNVRNSFTKYDGVIDYQFDLYRGDRT